MTTSAKVRRYLANGKSADYIAKALGIPKNYVWTIVWKERKKAEAEAATTAKPKKPGRPKKAAKKNEVSELQQSVVDLSNNIPDLVNHPAHYTAGGIETLDFIEAKDLNYRLGNVIKYVSRAGKKASDPVQDLEKAAFYLKREIDARKGA